MNDDQKAYAFAPTYGYGYTAFHRNMISVVVFSYSNELQIMFVDYSVTDIGLSNDYSELQHAPKQ